MKKAPQNIRINGWELKKIMEENCICPISVSRRFGLCDSYVRINANRGTMRQDIYDFIMGLAALRSRTLTNDFDDAQDEPIQQTCGDGYGIHIRFDEQGKPVVTVMPEGGCE